MFTKGMLVALGIAAGTLFGVGLGMGVLVGSQWNRVVDSVSGRGFPGKRKQVRYGALQQ